MSHHLSRLENRKRQVRSVVGGLAALGLLAAAGVRSSAAPAASPVSPQALQNWPQWRGPLNTGTAPKGDPPVTFSETSNVRWKVKIPGSGTATPIVWGNQVFIQTAVPAVTTTPPAPPAEPPAPPAPPAAPQAAPQPPQGAAPPPPAAGQPPAGQPGNPPPGRGFGRPGGFGGQGRPGGPGGPGGGMRVTQPTEVYRFTLICLDRATGKTLWQRVAREELPHEGHHPDGSFASHSPLTDGKYVWAYFGSRGLHCYDLKGNLKWSKDLGQMKTKMSFGEGSSPTLYGNTLVINWDHEGDDFIVALDKNTGEELWRQPRQEDTSWGTPLVVQVNGKPQVVTAATSRIRSYDLASGKQIWECEGLTPNSIPSPVAADGMVYATSGFRGNKLVAIRLGKEGDLTGTDSIVWSHDRNTPYVPSPLLAGNRIYFYSNNQAILSCFDAKTGKPLIDAERLSDLGGVYASPVAAAGRVYLVGRTGKVMVLKEADTLEVLATNQLEERFDASPAVAGKELFLRGHEYLYCVAEPAAKSKPAAKPKRR